MITVKRFLSYFNRVHPASPDTTQVRFTWGSGDKELYLLSVEYNTSTNIWTVKLSSS